MVFLWKFFSHSGFCVASWLFRGLALKKIQEMNVPDLK
jgi:hypothetical protein